MMNNYVTVPTVFRSAAKIYRAHFWKLLKLSTIFALWIILFNAFKGLVSVSLWYSYWVQTGYFSDMTAYVTNMPTTNTMFNLLIWTYLAWLIGFIAIEAVALGYMQALLNLARGGQATIGTLFSRFDLFLPYLGGITITHGIATALILFGIFLLRLPLYFPQITFFTGFNYIWLILLSIVFMLAGWYWYIRFWLFPICLIDQKQHGVSIAITQAWQLTAQQPFMVMTFLAFFFFTCIYIAGSGLLFFFANVPALLFLHPFAYLILICTYE